MANYVLYKLYSHVQLHNTSTNICGNIVNNNDDFNERTHFFIKIYLSHFILERVDVGCMWEMSWKQRQTAIMTPSSSWLGCSTVGH